MPTGRFDSIRGLLLIIHPSIHPSALCSPHSFLLLPSFPADGNGERAQQAGDDKGASSSSSKSKKARVAPEPAPGEMKMEMEVEVAYPW